jgi:hypothetical protein
MEKQTKRGNLRGKMLVDLALKSTGNNIRPNQIKDLEKRKRGRSIFNIYVHFNAM